MFFISIGPYIKMNAVTSNPTANHCLKPKESEFTSRNMEFKSKTRKREISRKSLEIGSTLKAEL